MASKTLLLNIQRAIGFTGARRAALSKTQPETDRLTNVDSVLADLIGLERDTTSFSKMETLDNTENINAELPVLHSYHPSNNLSKEDFQSLNSDVPVKCLMKGRYLNSLTPTGAYYLVFDSMDNLHSYYNHYKAHREDQLLNGVNINLKPVSTANFTEEFRFLYPQYLLDLKDLLPLVSIIIKGIEAKGTEGRPLTESLNMLLKNRLNTCHTMFGRKMLKTIGPNPTKLRHQIRHPPEDHQLIDRSCCVVFKNVPANIDTRKITDFFWDLHWHTETERRARPIFTDKTSNLTTYILVFADAASAARCVQRADSRHLFYNRVLPTVHAELL